jgi:hypothetical protein
MNHIKELRQAYRAARRAYEDEFRGWLFRYYGSTAIDAGNVLQALFEASYAGIPLLAALRLAEDALQDALDDAAEANSVMIHAVLREVGSDMVQIAREMQQKMAVTEEKKS